MRKASGKSTSKPVATRVTSATTPKPPTARKRATSAVDPDEIAPEYDFRGARPNPYAARYAEKAMAVVLDPDVAAAFPSAEAVNDVLRTVAGLIREHPPAKRARARRSA